MDTFTAYPSSFLFFIIVDILKNLKLSTPVFDRFASATHFTQMMCMKGSLFMAWQDLCGVGDAVSGVLGIVSTEGFDVTPLQLSVGRTQVP